MKNLLWMVVLGAALALPLSGCVWHRKSKPSTHIYSGDAPGMRGVDKPETAGGALNTY